MLSSFNWVATFTCGAIKGLEKSSLMADAAISLWKEVGVLLFLATLTGSLAYCSGTFKLYEANMICGLFLMVLTIAITCLQILCSFNDTAHW